MNIRQYKLNNHRFDKIRVGESGRFSRWVIIATENKYFSGSSPNGNQFWDMDLGITCMLAVEKNGIWICWRPGWGVDIHYPLDRCPESLQRSDTMECGFVSGGKCRCDGSALADGEVFYPAFNANGHEGVFERLQEWWRDPRDEDEPEAN